MILLLRQPPKLLGKNRNPRNHYAAHHRKQQWEELAAWSYKSQRRLSQPIDPDRLPHDLRFALPLDQPGRADPHNYTSYEVAWIIDGLVKVGALLDDTAAHVRVHDPILYQREADQLRIRTPVVVAIDDPLPGLLVSTGGNIEIPTKEEA